MSDPYTDLSALINQAPEAAGFTIQELWNGQSANQGSRYIILQSVGGVTDEDVERVSFTIWFISRVNDSGLVGFKSDSRAIANYLAKNYKSNCQIGLNVTSSLGTVRPLSDGRFWRSMDVQVLYSIS